MIPPPDPRPEAPIDERALEAVELLLAATFHLGKAPRPGTVLKFLFGTPGSSLHDRRIGEQLSMDEVDLVRASLFVRRQGHPYLRSLAMREVQGLLTDFLTEHYGLLAEEIWAQKRPGPHGEAVSAMTKQRLANALARSPLFAPNVHPTLFPLVPVRVEADFEAESFFLVRPEGLTEARLRAPLHPDDLRPTQFPPYAGWGGIRQAPAAWLGVRSPSPTAAKKRRSAILGAVALLPHRHERYLFTGRKVFGGRATYQESWAISLGESHTPPLSEDLVLGAHDHPWLGILAAKLEASDLHGVRQVKALEYYYRAWFLSETERFPVLFQALDALFSDAGAATQAVISAVGPIMGAAFDYKRLKLLLSLRGSVVHGGAPDVYDSANYIKYYDAYGEDPIHDLEQIAAASLQQVIFEGALVSRPHTYAALIKAKTGRDI